MSTDFKPGDRVRVEFDGVVVSTQFHVGDTLAVRGAAGLTIVTRDEVTKYDPPVKVGDVLITVEQVRALPIGAVFIDEDTLVNECWNGAYATTGRRDTVRADAVPLPATVIFLPGDAE